MGVVLNILAVLMIGATIYLFDRRDERKDKEISRLTNLLIARNPAEAAMLQRNADPKPAQLSKPAEPRRTPLT